MARDLTARAKSYGTELALRIAVAIKSSENLSLEEASRRVAQEVAERANEMLTSGKAREDVLLWIKGVQEGFREALDKYLDTP